MGKKSGSGIRDKHPGSATLDPDPDSHSDQKIPYVFGPPRSVSMRYRYGTDPRIQIRIRIRNYWTLTGIKNYRIPYLLVWYRTSTVHE
jgi:hypothetical protein